MLQKRAPDSTGYRFAHHTADTTYLGVGARRADELVEWAVDLYIRLEADRRKGSHQSFILNAAQVILHPDAKPAEVRLNQEVKIGLSGPRYDKEPEEIEAKDLDLIGEEDRDAAHVTFLEWWRGWLLHFDFRYNSTPVSEMVEGAEAFLETAAYSLSKDYLRPFVDNLYSTVELLAKGRLFLRADKATQNAKGHKTLHTQYNLLGRADGKDARYAYLLNRLSSLRPPARYLEGSLELSTEEAYRMLATAEEMLTALKEDVPKRVPAGRV